MSPKPPHAPSSAGSITVPWPPGLCRTQCWDTAGTHRSEPTQTSPHRLRPRPAHLSSLFSFLVPWSPSSASLSHERPVVLCNEAGTPFTSGYRGSLPTGPFPVSVHTPATPPRGSQGPFIPCHPARSMGAPVGSPSGPPSPASGSSGSPGGSLSLPHSRDGHVTGSHPFIAPL